MWLLDVALRGEGGLKERAQQDGVYIPQEEPLIRRRLSFHCEQFADIPCILCKQTSATCFPQNRESVNSRLVQWAMVEFLVRESRYNLPLCALRPQFAGPHFADRLLTCSNPVRIMSWNRLAVISLYLIHLGGI